MKTLLAKIIAAPFVLLGWVVLGVVLAIAAAAVAAGRLVDWVDLHANHDGDDNARAKSRWMDS